MQGAGTTNEAICNSIPAFTQVVYKSAYLATFPHIHGVDGAFAARLRKAQSGSNSGQMPRAW